MKISDLNNKGQAIVNGLIELNVWQGMKEEAQQEYLLKVHAQTSTAAETSAIENEALNRHWQGLIDRVSNADAIELPASCHYFDSRDRSNRKVLGWNRQSEVAALIHETDLDRFYGLLKTFLYNTDNSLTGDYASVANGCLWTGRVDPNCEKYAAIKSANKLREAVVLNAENVSVPKHVRRQFSAI